MSRRDPDKKSDHASAWKVQVPDSVATIASWLVQVPGAHAFWDHWWIAMVHLRDIPGQEAPKKSTPESSHELLVLAVNPEKCPVPDPDAAPFEYLQPIDVCEQFAGVTDEQAVTFTEQAVDAILAGRLSPDSDFRELWRQMIARFVQRAHEAKPPTG